MSKDEHHPLSPAVILSGIIIAVGAAIIIGEGRFSLPSTPQNSASKTSSPSSGSVSSATATPDVFIPTPVVHKSPNLLKNGDFLSEYDGWEQTLDSQEDGKSIAEIILFGEGDSGKAMHLKHEGNGGVTFSQEVNVPSPDLIFSATFRASAKGAIFGTGIATIMLSYADANGNVLGRTLLIAYVENMFAGTGLAGIPERKKSDDISYIDLKQGSLYRNHAIDIRQEIESHLLTMNADKVRKISISLYTGANDKQASAEMFVTDLYLGIKQQ